MRIRSKILPAIILLMLTRDVFSQSAHTDLKDPELLKRFRTISETLVCTCGCKMPLQYCNHRPCNAWAMRAVIEGLLLDGKTNDFIIQGFVHGFGGLYDTHPAFEKPRTEAHYAAMEKGFRNGFGEEHLARPKDNQLAILILLSSLVIAGTALAFIKLRYRKLNGDNASATENAPGKEKEAEHLTTKEEDDLYKKLYE